MATQNSNYFHVLLVAMFNTAVQTQFIQYSFFGQAEKLHLVTVDGQTFIWSTFLRDVPEVFIVSFQSSIFN